MATTAQDNTLDEEVGTEQATEKLSLRQVIGSVLAAGFGVQSSKNRERDFSRGSPGTFIIAGFFFTLGFIATVVLLVRVVLRASGAA